MRLSGPSFFHTLALLLVAAATVSGCAPPTGGLDFDGERAFADLRALVALGPRPAGSRGSSEARTLITGRLRQAGWPVREQRFVVHTPDGSPVEMTNLIAELGGERPDWVLFGTHYDTKRIEGEQFVGANDGASGVALLLELARQVAPTSRPLGVRLVFFDGEESFGSAGITPEDGLYGSRAFVSDLEYSGELGEIRAVVVVDMVADTDLDLVEDLYSSEQLRRWLREAAGDLDLASILEGPRMPVLDDHFPFVERGVPALCVIDFRYGARTVPGPLWHTSRDGLDAVSVESLNTVGRLVVELYTRMRADLAERPPDSGE